ncbi:MAG: flagellar hook-length control protein FliK [Desulfobacterales bacterium]|nr:flagellar hook-length control protein FliK [Desulfobacterales bacterium]
MDFTFMNMNGAMMSMFGGQGGGLQGMPQGTADMDPKQFLNQLNRIVQQHQSRESAGSAADTSGGGSVAELLGESMEGEEGISFLTQLKSLFLALSNGDLDNLSVTGEGLEALEQLLVKAGFDPSSIEALTEDLHRALENSEEVTVSDFMADLFELPKAEESDTEFVEAETLLATSDVPYMHTILSMFGLPEDKVAEIMAESSRGNQGFSLDTAVDMLRQFETSAFASGNIYKTETGENSFVKLFESLGLTMPSGKGDESLSLAGLIGALEQKQTAGGSGPLHSIGMTDSGTLQNVKNMFAAENPILQNTQMPLFNQAGAPDIHTNTTHQELFAQLFSGLETSSSADTAQASAPTDMVTGQIRDQIKNDLINPVKDMMAGVEDSTRGAANRINPATLAAQANPEGNSQTHIGDLAASLGEKSAMLGKSTDEKISYTDVSQLAQGGEKTGSLTSLESGAQSAAKAKQTFNSLPAHVTNQVGKNIVRAVNLGESTLHLQLKPAELGRVFMTIDNSGDSMKVSIITENQSAKDILAANVNEIKTILSSSGISLEKFDVDMSGDFRQSMADARGQGGQSGKKKSGQQGKSEDNLDNDITTQLNTLPHEQANNGAMHFVA